MEQTILLVHTNNQAQTCLIPFGCGSGTSVDFIYVPFQLITVPKIETRSTSTAQITPSYV